MATIKTENRYKNLGSSDVKYCSTREEKKKLQYKNTVDMHKNFNRDYERRSDMHRNRSQMKVFNERQK